MSETLEAWRVTEVANSDVHRSSTLKTSEKQSFYKKLTTGQ